MSHVASLTSHTSAWEPRRDGNLKHGWGWPLSVANRGFDSDRIMPHGQFTQALVHRQVVYSIGIHICALSTTLYRSSTGSSM
jgi:hypothetical protein